MRTPEQIYNIKEMMRIEKEEREEGMPWLADKMEEMRLGITGGPLTAEEEAFEILPSVQAAQDQVAASAREVLFGPKAD
jgi:hypothetical protein